MSARISSSRLSWTWFALTIVLMLMAALPSAKAQLSRARSAVRRETPTAPPPAVKETTPEPTPTPAASPAIAEPQPAPPPVAAPAPESRPPQPKNATPTVNSTRTEHRQPAGRLNAVRARVRQPAPASPPVHKPTPRPAPQPPFRAHSRPPVYHRPHVHHHYNHRLSAPLFTPSYSTQTVIVENISPPPQIFEQPLLIPQSVTPADELLIPGELREIAPTIHEPIEIPGSVSAQAPFVGTQCIEPWRFAGFPYEHGLPGMMARGLEKEWSGNLLFEYGSNFDRLERHGLGVLIEHASRVGIDFKWDSYVEDLGHGWTDELHFTDVNVLFRLAQSEHYIVRAGLGMNILGDAYATDAGFNVTAKADLFPIKPLVVSGELDLGTIGDAETFHVLGKAGLMFDRFEIFGGYDYRTIGSIPLEGAMLGVQIWF